MGEGDRGGEGPGRILLILLLALLTACGPSTTDPGQPTADPIAAEAHTAQPRTTAAPLEVPATVEAVRQVRPGSKLLGRVAAVTVREGEEVRRGQVLARLESADLEAVLAQARAAVIQAEAEQANALAQKQRYDELARRGSVTPRALEEVTTRFQVAEAALAQARAGVRAAEVQLGYAAIESPLDGWVVERRVEAGDMVAPGAVLFTLEDLSRVKVVAEIPEEAVARGAGQPGSGVEVEILGRAYPAQIDRLLPAGDPRSRTFAAHILLPQPSEKNAKEGDTFKSGMFARVRLDAPEGAEAAGLWVPITALVHRGQLEGVYVVDESGAIPQARLRWLRLGEERDGAVEVLAGLEAGERYLPTPPAGLTDGALLFIKKLGGTYEDFR